MSVFGLLRGLKPNDVLELSRLYEAEFNQPDLHDRVLVFDVVASCLRRDSEVNQQSEDGRLGKTAETESKETGMNANKDFK